MTREEQIKEAARQRADQYDHPSKWNDTYYGFVDGAKWADQHHQMKPENKLQDFKNEVEKLREIDGAEEYAKQLAHLFLGNGLSLQTILLMAIDFGQQHPQWIPVEERLPKENQSVFICNARHDYGTALYQGGEWFITREYVAINVTHWMEIVPPRKED